MFSEKKIELMKIEIQIALEDYETAELNFKSTHYRAALNRLYYSIFHMMSARLDLDGLGFIWALILQNITVLFSLAAWGAAKAGRLNASPK